VPKITYIIITAFLVSFNYANASEYCKTFATKTDTTDDNYRPPLEARFTGNAKLYFYSAPSIDCKMKKTFVIKGDSLTVYKTYDGWANVMFIGKKGNDYTGWVRESKIKLIRQYGRNP
jgi:hypothetical protein